jgi:TubC N-terminal docking domain
LNAQALVDEARAAGIKFAMANGQIRLAAPTPPPPELLARLRQHKAEIAALLREDSPEPDPAELEERRGMASNGVPERYPDAWATFQLQCPGGVTEQTWRQAIDDAGRFLAQWGKLADSFGWSPGDLFDVPRDGAMGLVWWLKGRTVSALGSEHAGVGQPCL